jgi:predicted O-linked N-acetylglucosamine transferase (SPINDLY family)
MNNVIKLSPQTLAAWARILEATPESRLCLTGVPQGSGREWLQQRLASFGIAPERVILHGRLPAERFYALADEIDIALDPFPYNGTTTTCEALWMGIPVVSVVGATSVSRCGYALLKSVGLEELCGRDEAGYVRIATGLAGDLNRLATLRHCMRPRLEASPLRDEAGLARDIEEAYRAMWRKWCRS